jgi:predicted unusual protein kinase regulating ubiquinone biosynthesis (AarF/ABC1/UbiB family)
MPSYLIVVLAVLAAAALALGVLFYLGRHGRLPSGRLARISSIGRLSAGMSASWLGATIRRLFASQAGRERIDEARRKADAERVTQTMGQMKGAFMKLGQMMSFIEGGIPAEYQAALKQLQQEAPPMDFALVRDTVERELGKPLERAFAHFEQKPLASASIGQVHRARLPSGEEVVVKVQYPGVADAIRADLANAELLQRSLKLIYPAHDPDAVIDELRGRIFEEFDYRNELVNQTEFADLYAGHPHFHIPRPFPSHSSGMVLTSEFVRGRRFDDVCNDAPEARGRYAEIIYRFVFGSIMRHRLFNGDPHPGNYLFGDDGRVVFLDFGCVKRFGGQMSSTWAQLIASHFMADHEGFRRGAIALGFLKQDTAIDADQLYEYFQYFYEPFRFDREFGFSREYIAASFRQVFAPEGRFAGMQKRMTMPGDFVFVNRIQWGVFSILGRLGAKRNFHRIHREYLWGEPAWTPLGEEDQAYWEKRGISHAPAAPPPASFAGIGGDEPPAPVAPALASPPPSA